jgi:hypothetical protein
MIPSLRILLSASALALVLALPALAERKPFAMGLLGGVGAASLWGDDVEELDLRIWPTTGISMAGNLPAFLGIEADVIYSSKGSGFSGREAFAGYPDGRLKVTTVTAHCIDFPLLLKVTAPTGNEVMPIFFGGPAFSWFASKKVTTEWVDFGQGGTVSSQPATPLVEEGNVPDYEWNLTIGGGVEWGLGTFQARLALAQESLDKSKTHDVRTFLVSILAGFIF